MAVGGSLAYDYRPDLQRCDRHSYVDPLKEAI